ncbi:MAG: dihydrolipoyl dehydrogenase [Gammaproteobacteria bacterium]
MSKEVKIPDIGGFEGVEVIDVLVSEGDAVEKEDSLITLESDKAAMDVPAPFAGTVKELKVKTGDKVSEGDVILTVEEDGEGGEDEDKEEQDGAAKEKPESEEGQGQEDKKGEGKEEQQEQEGREEDKRHKDKESGGNKEEKRDRPEEDEDRDGQEEDAGEEREEAEPEDGDTQAFEEAKEKADLACEVLVLGSGPGGYTAAFRAADLGCEVVLLERYKTLGGVCLNVGCIPSKALLHAGDVIEQAQAMRENGIAFGAPKIKLPGLRRFKQNAVKKLTGGLGQLAKKRKVKVVTGKARFVSPHLLEVAADEGKQTIAFARAIIAAGSEPMRLPDQPEDSRIMDSTGALELADIPKKLLVVGGGIIGLEMAQAYAALGSAVTVVELTDGLMPGTDRDLVKSLAKKIEAQFEAVHLETKVESLKPQKSGIQARCSGPDGEWNGIFGRVLVAIGRKPNGNEIGAEAADITVDERGFIPTDEQMRTNVRHIFAIGDITRPPLLAHKASHEGKIAAEAAAGQKSAFDARAIPSVAYTHPEVAWAGLTETEAKEKGVAVDKAVFPWQANGRALTLGVEAGATKLLFDKTNGRLVGAGIVGPNAGELISELVLAIEMGCDAEDIALSIHPHPTLSESVGMAAEIAAGTITDLYLPKKS